MLHSKARLSFFFSLVPGLSSSPNWYSVRKKINIGPRLAAKSIVDQVCPFKAWCLDVMISLTTPHTTSVKLRVHLT